VITACAAVITCSFAASVVGITYGAPVTFPQTRTVDQVENFHGTDVPDPYRWLEDQTSSEVADWARAQAAVTADYLRKLPGRERLAARLDELSGLATSSAPELHGGRWFRLTNDGSQQQSLVRVSHHPMDEGRVLLDPNPASPEGTTALAGAVPDRTGQLVAWSYREAGSDWCRWRVRDVDTGEDSADDIRWAKFVQPTWLRDSSGFVYSRYPPTDPDDIYSAAAGAPQLMLHRLGQEQSADELLLAMPDEPTTTFWPWIDDSGRWLVAVSDDSTADVRAVWVRDLDDPDGEFRRLTAPSDNEWELVGSDEQSLIMRTDLDAGRGRLVRLDPRSGEVTTLVAERGDLLLSADAAAAAIVIHWLSDARSAVTVHDFTGAETGRIPLPGLGSVGEITASTTSSLVHLEFSAYEMPPRILAHDLATGATETVFAGELPVSGVGEVVTEVVTDQVWITSADGTRLPAFVLHRADVTPENGPHSCVLYGYGGFNVSVTPAFSAGALAFAEAGGVWVVANLRGGGEYGAEWHDAGRLANKQNVFDDAIATAEHLIAAGWTTAERLAANGGSNGGLLVGALITQRPDLFAAAVPQVGVLDMLRYERFTIGWAWASDYGIASRSKLEFDALSGYSPLHRLQAGTSYPATLVMTSDHDDRVVPAHSFKFAARLQAVSPDNAVALLRVEYAAGHGQGKSRTTLIQERTDLLAFIAHHTGLVLD